MKDFVQVCVAKRHTMDYSEYKYIFYTFIFTVRDMKDDGPIKICEILKLRNMFINLLRDVYGELVCVLGI